MSGFDLKSTHVSCIYYLYTMQSLTAKELCEVCEEDKAAVSRSLEHLEKNDFIRLSDSDTRKYKRSIVLTEKGFEVGKRLSDRIDSILESASEGVSKEDRETMYRTLATISENLQKLCDEYDNN